MIHDDVRRPPDDSAPSAPAPQRGRRRATRSGVQRAVDQVQAVDAWLSARRDRERLLHHVPTSRDQRLDVAREVDALRTTHEAIKGCCARASDPGSRRPPGATAVVAHRHAWFADELAVLLEEQGAVVLVCTDNGAEALGTVVAEQPDVLLAGDRLAMVPGRALLAATRDYSPGTLRALYASDQRQADVLRAVADAVFLRPHPPGVLAAALVALHLTTCHTYSP